MAAEFFPGFERFDMRVNAARIHGVCGGAGPPLLLLHGYPETHLMWHLVAPKVAQQFTVVCADLRGYGESRGPQSDAGHIPYSKRVMGEDQLAMMRHLGFERFGLAGHDRGARVAYRLALDHPEAITRLALLDIVPTSAVWGAIGGELALDYFNWLFLAQPEPLPERLIGAETEFFVNWIIDQWAGDGAAISSEARAEYIRCLDENSIHAICEEYRAGATVDVAHDHEDRSRGVAIPCPVLCLWSTTGTGRQFDVLNEWRKLAGDVRGRPLDCGHFLPEERPAEVAEELVRFFGEPGRSHGP